jgi:hypothetical protein
MPVDERFWRKATKDLDAIRIAVELALNSGDSYSRLKQQGLAKPPFEIWVKYAQVVQYAGSIEVKDEAEGMDSKQIRKSLTYGAATSGIDKGFSVRGAMGLGLKDSFMAMKKSNMISVKDGQISEFDFVMEEGRPYIVPVREDEVISDQERKKLGIPKNGTIVRGLLPPEFKKLKLEQFKQSLTSHFMMRKILQINDYELLVGDGSFFTSFERLMYKPPIGRLLMSKSFTISYAPFGDFEISLSVKKATKDLSLHGDFRDAGLVHYHDDYAVIDCTLWGFENDPFARSLFGEVQIRNFSVFLNKEEDVIDEKRRGLNKKHPFVEKLVFEIDTRLRHIIDQERKSLQEEMFSLNQSSVREALRELNNVAKEEGALGKVYIPHALKTKTMVFSPNFVEAFEYLEKTIYLVINPLIVNEDRKISINSDNSKIDVHPQEIILSEQEIESKKCVVKRVTIIGKEAGLKGQIGAEICEHIAIAGVNVAENPMLRPSGGFAFVPAETKIVDHNEKKVSLIIDKDLIKINNDIRNTILLSTSNPKISCSEKFELPDKLDSLMLGPQMIRLQIPIVGEGPGEKSKVQAQFQDARAELSVEVLLPFETHGLFRSIEFVPGEGVNTICYFDGEAGKIFIYYTHPLVEKYWSKDREKSIDFLVFAADTVARLICWEILKKKEKRGALEIMNRENMLNEMQTHFDEIYFKRGRQLHNVLINLIKTLKND